MTRPLATAGSHVLPARGPRLPRCRWPTPPSGDPRGLAMVHRDRSSTGNSGGPPPPSPNDWRALRLILAILPQPVWF